jgi:hypothetical protein
MKRVKNGFETTKLGEAMKKISFAATVLSIFIATFSYALDIETHKGINAYIAQHAINGFSLDLYLGSAYWGHFSMLDKRSLKCNTSACGQTPSHQLSRRCLSRHLPRQRAAEHLSG